MPRSERGAALVEFAMALPLLLVVIAGIVDFGFTFQRFEVVTNAAREGARLATLPGYNATAVDSRVRQYVKEGLNLTDAALLTAMPTSPPAVSTTLNQSLTVDLGGGNSATVNTAVVTVRYHSDWFLLGPMLGLINHTWGQSVTLTAQSQMRMEQ